MGGRDKARDPWAWPPASHPRVRLGVRACRSRCADEAAGGSSFCCGNPRRLTSGTPGEWQREAGGGAGPSEATVAAGARCSHPSRGAGGGSCSQPSVRKRSQRGGTSMEKRKKKVRVGGALSRMPTEHPGRLAVTSQSLAGYVANRCKKPHRHPPRTMGTMGAMAAWERCPSSASRSREQRTDAAQRRGCRRLLFWAGTPICWIARRALLRWGQAKPQHGRR